MTELYDEPEVWDVLDAELEDILEQQREANRRQLQWKAARQAAQVDTEEPDDHPRTAA